MKVLSFDTSHPRRTVIELLWETQSLELALDIESSQQDKLLYSIHHLLSTIGGSLDMLDAIVVGKGPGSFTGLRIGISLAKGFAWAASLPLYPISSLEALAFSFPWEIQPHATVIASIDARMKKLYTTIYHAKTQVLPESDLSPEELAHHIATQPAPYYFVGDLLYREIFTTILGEKSCIFLQQWIKPSLLRQRALLQRPLSHDELLSFEPLYLRKSEAENQKITKNAQ